MIFTFVMERNINPPDEGELKFPIIEYIEGATFEEARLKVNDHFILAAFEGKLEPLRGEIWDERIIEEQNSRSSDYKRPGI